MNKNQKKPAKKGMVRSQIGEKKNKKLLRLI